MKKLTLIIALFAALTSVGCYEDKSTLATDPIDGVEFNVTDEEKVIRIGYKDQLDIVPNITKGGKSDLSGLEYEWAINLIAGWTSSDFVVVGDEKELHTVLDNPVNSEYYNLRLLVTDTMHDNLQYSFLYRIYVEPSIKDGLLVCDTKDGATSDFHIVMNDKLTGFYSGAEKIYRNLLSDNAIAYNGLIKSLMPIGSGYHPGNNYVYAIDQNNKLVGYNSSTFDAAITMEKAFIYAPQEVSTIVRIGQEVCAFTDLGVFLSNYVNFDSSYYGWFSSTMSGYNIDNGVYAATSLHGIGADNSINSLGAWFCNEQDAFISADMAFYPAPGLSMFENGDHNLANKSAVAGGMSVDEVTPSFLLKDDITGEYTIYVLARKVEEQGDYDDDWNWIVSAPAVPAHIKAAYTVPAEGKALLDKAVAIDFASLESIIYVATAEGVYTINFAGTTPTVNTVSQFSAQGETITGVQLYQQGSYVAYQENAYNPDNAEIGGWEKLAWNNRAVIVTTQKGDEGVVYVVPMVQFGTGNLDAANALRYDGFGRILAVTTTCY